MLYPNQPEQSYTFMFVFPWSQIYPPPPPPPPPPPQRDLSVLVSTSICIIGSVLLFLFLTVFLYLYLTQSSSRRRSSPSAVTPVSTNNRREEENEEETGGERDHHHFWRITTAGLQRSAIESITVVGFKKGEGVMDATDCSVCLSEFEEDESLRLLPQCRHAFHVSCIDMWLLSHKNCPLCRAPVFSSTEVRDKKTESGSREEEEEESSGSRNGNVLLPRSRSDLARHCGGGSGGRLETVRRSFSIGGGSSLDKGAEGSDHVGERSRRQFYSSFSANFFSSSRRTRNQDSVLPTRMPSHVSG